jgi:hypothetical protein
MAIPISLRRPLVLVALLALTLAAGLVANGRVSSGVDSVFAATGPCSQSGTAFFGSTGSDRSFKVGDIWQGGTFTSITNNTKMNSRVVKTGDRVGRFPHTSGGASATIVFAQPITITSILWYGNHPPGWSLNTHVGPDTGSDSAALCELVNIVTDTVTIETRESGGIDFWFNGDPGNGGGGEGCTPGYWKNHTDSWAPSGYSTTDLVSSVFTNPPFFGGNTLLQALQGGGGPGVQGATKILLRAATASLLNSAHPGVSFDMSTADVINAVNAALASNDRATMIALAGDLDDANNEGCPLN